jgi:hypothetical protein
MITTDAFVGRRHAVQRHLVCAMQGQFPVLVRAAGDELACVFRAGGGHYGLPATLATVWSADGGCTWSDPIDLAPRGSDTRNPAFGVAADGRWLVAYWRAGVRAYPGGRWRMPDPVEGPDDMFVVATSDRGRTWTEPRAIRGERLAWSSPFGRMVTLADGTMLMAAYGPSKGAKMSVPFDAVVLRSRDGGTTWGDDSLVLAGASELSVCETAPGTLAGAVRRAGGDTVIVTSHDGGRTWSEPIAATRPDEHPGDLCVLRASGRLLLTFGRRRRPLGCGALVSADGGATWDRDREVVLAGDGIGNDVGYPSTVQHADGTLVTALYFARGSTGSEGMDGWGETSCQALRYSESLVTG